MLGFGFLIAFDDAAARLPRRRGGSCRSRRRSWRRRSSCASSAPALRSIDPRLREAAADARRLACRVLAGGRPPLVGARLRGRRRVRLRDLARRVRRHGLRRPGRPADAARRDLPLPRRGPAPRTRAWRRRSTVVLAAIAVVAALAAERLARRTRRGSLMGATLVPASRRPGHARRPPRRSTASTSAVEPGRRSWPCSARAAVASRPCCARSPGSAAPRRGPVTLDGRDLAGVPPHRRGIGLMFQDDALFPHRDVAAQRRLRSAHAGRADAASCGRRVAELLDLVGLEGRERRDGRVAVGRRAQAGRAGPRARAAPARAAARRAARRARPAAARPARRSSCGSCSPRSGRPRSTSPTTSARRSRSAQVAVMRDGENRPGRDRRDGSGRDPADAWVARFIGLANVEEHGGPPSSRGRRASSSGPTRAGTRSSSTATATGRW